MWADPAVQTNEVLVVLDRDALQPLGILTIVNFTAPIEPLDRLAQI